MKPPTYSPLESDEEQYCPGAARIPNNEPSVLRFSTASFVILAQQIIIILLCILLIWPPVNHGSFQAGWQDTELHAAFDSIKIHKSFISKPAYLAIGPPQSEYVGPPTEELETAWRLLLAPTVLDLNDQEIGMYAGQTAKTELGWTTGLGVYHTLHCINGMRRAVYQHVYGAPDKYELYHLDLLRLSAQCQSDLTPLLYIDYNGTMGTKPHEHTCRDFDAVHKWAKTKSRCGDDGFVALLAKVGEGESNVLCGKDATGRP
ncbi:hypothetical protein LZ32DRAFT_616409 [Colletotrichum eremochloae]|nr:hypothetical protein LZ32DRAFT_616409 [Colletotrichum eremochloae]